MSPKEYFSLLFKCFFKRYSLEKDKNVHEDFIVIEANVYSLALNCLLLLLMYMLCLGYNYGVVVLKHRTIPPTPQENSLSSFLYAIWGTERIIFDFFNYLGFVILGVILGICVISLFIDSLSNIIAGFIGGIISLCGIALDIFDVSINDTLNNSYLSFYLGSFLGIVFSFISTALIRNYKVSIVSGIITSIFFIIKFNCSVVFIISFIFIYLLLSTRLFYYIFFTKLHYDEKNPLVWDENINIPIWFLSNYLRSDAKTKDFDKPINFAKFLIENRPIQRKQAQKSLIFIALDKMKGFHNIDNIRELSFALSFMPSSNMLVDEYNNQLQFFVLISEDLNKVRNELNNNNRINIYERMQQKLYDYHKSTNLSNSTYTKDFDKVATKWQEILKRSINELSLSGSHVLPNPYILGKVIQPNSELFLGRRDIIQKIETETLREGSATALLFIGNRRTGKSSTLNNLQQFVQSAVRTVFVDLQDPEVNNSSADFYETLTERIAKAFKISAPKQNRELIYFSIWLKELDETLVDEKRYLLICIDEYERLEYMIKQGKLVDLPNSLRRWIQHLQHIVFLFAGSHEPSELKGDLDWTDYLINVRNVPISYLEYEAAMQLVTAPVPNFDLTWATDDLAHNLVLRLGRQPYLLQCTMWNLVENLNNQSRKEATQTDIDEALDKVLEGDAVNHFQHFWQTEMTDATRLTLSNLARNTQPTEGSVLNGLKRKEIVKMEDGVYVFCVPLLKEWILRNVD
jgi:hypothetical protein